MKPVVLVVDDNPVNQQLIEWALEDEAVVHVIGNGRQCCALAQEVAPDLIFLDLMMPAYSGFDVLAEMKAGAPHLLAKTVVISARDDREARNQAEAFGIAGFRRKPLEIEQVQGLLKLASPANAA